MANTTTQFTIKINGKDELVDLNQLINQNAQSVGELKDQQNALQQAFEQADYGTAAFNQLQSELKGVNSQIKTVDESVEGLTFDEKLQGASQAIGAIGSAFAFASVSVQAFGDENGRTAEELQKLETQIMAIQQGFTAFSELTSAFTKKDGLFKQVLNGLSKGFNAVGISAKGAGLAVRGALIATGIGVLVAGVSFLIANFDDIKSAGGDIFKAWQPFFDAVRNFASLVTFGLINNAETAKIVNALDNTAEQIIKINEKTNASIELSNLKLSAGLLTKTQALEENLNASTTALDDAVVAQSNSFSEIISQIEIGYNKIKNAEGQTLNPVEIFEKVQAFNKLNKEIEKGGTVAQEALKKQRELTEGILKTAKDGDATYGKTVLTLKQYNESILLIGKNQNSIQKQSIENTTIQNQLNQEQVNQLNKIADEQFKIQQLNLQIRELRTQSSQRDLDNFRAVLDVIKEVNLNLKTPINFGPSNSIKLVTEELNKLIQNINDPALRDFFVQFNNVPSNYLQGLDVILSKLDEFRLAERKTTRERIDNEIALNKTKLANFNKFETDQAQIDANNLAVATQNRLLERQKTELLDQINDKYRNINVELTKASNSYKDFTNQQNFSVLSQNLELAKSAIQEFVGGLALADSGAKLIKTTFGQLGITIDNIDFTKSFNLLTFQEQNDAIAQLQKNISDASIEIAKQQLKTTTTSQKENDIKKDTLDTLTAINEYYGKIFLNNKETIKLLNEELALLLKAEEIRKQQAIVDSPKSTYKQRVGAINEINKLELKNIKDKFDKETKGLKDTDERYKIALINRTKAEEELGKQTVDTLGTLFYKRFTTITDGINQGVQEFGQIFNDVLGSITEYNNTNIALLQEAADRINESISGVQEQISFLDGLINERKSIISELQQKAAEATGGQRQEILSQLDAEAEATRELVVERKKQQQQERELQKELAKNAKEQQKIEKENQKIAAASTIANQFLAVSTAAVAVAKAFNPDPTSEKLPLGIGLLIRATAAIAFASSLFGLLVSARNAVKLDAQGGYVKDAPTKKRADGGYTGSSTLIPDETGERPMYHTVQLHEKEWVAPRWMTQSPKYGSLINELEQTRVRGFADGGSIAPLSTQSISNEQLTGLLVANLNKPVYVAVTDINLGQSRVQVIENRGTL